jgi:hypothetical protein
VSSYDKKKLKFDLNQISNRIKSALKRDKEEEEDEDEFRELQKIKDDLQVFGDSDRSHYSVHLGSKAKHLKKGRRKLNKNSSMVKRGLEGMIMDRNSRSTFQQRGEHERDRALGSSVPRRARRKINTLVP